MHNEIPGSELLYVKRHMRECVYLNALRVGESHVELKVEVYELADGFFSTSVFALEFFNLEEGIPLRPSGHHFYKGVVPLYVVDEFYDTSNIKASSPADALKATLQIILGKLGESGCEIEDLS